jgi:hypothetical protein
MKAIPSWCDHAPHFSHKRAFVHRVTLQPLQGSGPSVRAQYAYMLAFSALVMAATLTALLLQPTSPLLSVLQDMDMWRPPSFSAPTLPLSFAS